MFSDEHQLPKLWEAHSEYQLMQDSMAQNIVLEELYAELPRLHSHQSEDMVRMLPEQLKAMMAEKRGRTRGRGGRLVWSTCVISTGRGITI